MAELDLAAAIEAGRVAARSKAAEMFNVEPEAVAVGVLVEVVEAAIRAAAPLIARAERELAAGELIAWADSLGWENNSSLRRLRRHAHQCAQRVAPKPTAEEVLEALARGDYVSCHLDDAGRAIPPSEREVLG